MLVLTRNIGETLRVGRDISLTLVAVKGSQVKLSITAPHSVPVRRHERGRRRRGQEGAAAAVKG